MTLRLLVTRPEPDGSALAARLRHLGHDPILAPLFEIKVRPISSAALRGAHGLVVTSQNALRSLEQQGVRPETLTLPLFAVGQATAEEARRLGFVSVVAGPGTAAGLASLIAKATRPEDGVLLHVAGEHVAHDMASGLKARGFDFRSEIAYEAVEVGCIPRTMREAIAGRSADGVILMSPRSAAGYARLISEAGLVEDANSMRHYCLSSAVAVKLKAFDTASIRIASRPTEDDLVNLLQSARGALAT